MVDPNRNLSKEQQAFLRECEDEFKHRYTEADPEYRALLTRETDDPPIITPWKERQGGGGRGGYNNHRGSGGGWQPRGHDQKRRYH